MYNNSQSTNSRAGTIRTAAGCLALMLILLGAPRQAEALGPCSGRFPNPVVDICWECLFPLHIGPVEISFGQRGNGDAPPPILCTCPIPVPPFFRIGIGISFWEPARVGEVVRTPFCSPTLGGIRLASLSVPSGNNRDGAGGHQGESFYQVHWFQYPALSWLSMGLSSALCFVSEPYDLVYMSELDPLWDSDQLTFILNPESLLFANPIAQAACIADTVQASLTDYGINQLFWCAGGQGSIYPISGTGANHIGGLESSLAVIHRHVFKMHRQLLAHDTSTTGAMCGGQVQPILRKTQYKQQMIYPIPKTDKALGFGVPAILWGAGKEFPYKGEDFAYLIWRKRKCCMW